MDMEMHQLQNQAQCVCQYNLHFVSVVHLNIFSLNTWILPLHEEEIFHDDDFLKGTILCLQETRDKTHAHLPLLNKMYNCYPSLAIHGILTCCAKITIVLKTNSFAMDSLESITIDTLHIGHTIWITNDYIRPGAPISDISNLMLNMFT